MKILINCADMRGTGVCQVSASFLNECKDNTEHDFIVFISDTVKRHIDESSFPTNFKFYHFDERPLISFMGWPNILRMKRLEATEAPDVTFSVFGPSYWRPKSPHLMGYAYSHYIYPESPIYDIISWKEKLDIKVRKLLHVTQLKKNGDYYVCETEDTMERWCKMYSIPRNHVWIAYNTASEPFLAYKPTHSCRKDDEFRFFTLCSPYRHKNLEILNEVCPLISDTLINKKVKFYTTLPEESVDKIFNEKAKEFIVNVGPQKVADCPKLVDQCDALFLPTLLECYSASYPEAMAMRKPIITSDLPFATTVCKDAALYFDPLNAQDVWQKIKDLINNSALYSELQEKGVDRLKEFGSAHDRAKAYLKICHDIVEMEKRKK